MVHCTEFGNEGLLHEIKVVELLVKFFLPFIPQTTENYNTMGIFPNRNYMEKENTEVWVSRK